MKGWDMQDPVHQGVPSRKGEVRKTSGGLLETE